MILFKLKFEKFCLRKCILKCCLQNGPKFVLASMSYWGASVRDKEEMYGIYSLGHFF